jgi:hypothetical protein
VPGESLQVSSAREPVRMLRCSREKELSVCIYSLSYVFTVCAGKIVVVLTIQHTDSIISKNLYIKGLLIKCIGINVFFVIFYVPYLNDTILMECANVKYIHHLQNQLDYLQ